MPTTGYDDDAMRAGGLRGAGRSWRFKTMLLAIFLAAIALGAGVASLVRVIPTASDPPR
jgi:hypothetical protein